MSVQLIQKLPIDILKIIESFLINYDEWKHNVIIASIKGDITMLKWLIIHKNSSINARNLKIALQCAKNYSRKEIINILKTLN